MIDHILAGKFSVMSVIEKNKEQHSEKDRIILRVRYLVYDLMNVVAFYERKYLSEIRI